MAESVITSSDMMKARFLQAYRLWNLGGKQGNVAIVVDELKYATDLNEMIEIDGCTTDVTREVQVHDLRSDKHVWLKGDDHFSQIGDVVSYVIRGEEGRMITNFTYEAERGSPNQMLANARNAYRLVFGVVHEKGK